MFSPITIQELILNGLPDSTAKARDLTGTNDHFELTVVSPSFDGKNAIERHRMVYKILGTLVGAEIHALTLNTLTPHEAETN